jgi:hypothetical protein
MFDPSQSHAEPLGEALSNSSQRAAQMVSLVAAATEVAMRRRALHAARQSARGEQEQRLAREQESAFRAQVRARWAPALDPRFPAQADLLQAGRAWGAAAPYAGADPEAAAALRRAEERLRTLHPYAMAQYDRLRGEGAGPLDAMRGSVHLFLREPNARPGQPAPARPAVEAGLPGPVPASDPWATPGAPGQPGAAQDPHLEAERRGRVIAERLQARALQEHGALLSPGELAVALEESTNLPAEVITRIARAEAEERRAAVAERARVADLGHAADARSPRVQAGDLKAARRDTLTADTAGAHASGDRSAARLAAESFPCTAADGIRASADGHLQSAQSAGRRPVVQNTSRLTVSS